jgi:hypothetical protein
MRSSPGLPTTGSSSGTGSSPSTRCGVRPICCATAGQAAAALEEAFSRAVGIVSQRPDAPEIVKDDADRQHPLSIASASRFRALDPTRCGSGWAGRMVGCSSRRASHGRIRASKPPAQARGTPPTTRLRASCGRPRPGGWVWWNYLPLAAAETDLDAYAVRHVEGLVDGWKALDSQISGR